jgi:hypothetical protein
MNQTCKAAIQAISVAILAAAPLVGAAAEVTLVPEGTGWETFAAPGAFASFAWAGEDEGFFARGGMLGLPRSGVEFDESEVDAELLTGLPAPEPPALVLAGLAFGGVLCGRSLVVRRRKAASGTDPEIETPRA